MSAGTASATKPSWSGRLLIACAVVSAVTAVGLLLAESRRDDPRTLVVPSRSLNFGTALARSDFRWTVPIENHSENTIAVEHVFASCSCTQVEPTRFTLAPGATQDLTVLLDLVPESRRIGASLAPMEVGLDLRGSDGRRLGFWTLHGVVKFPFVGTAEVAWFGPDELIEGVPSREKQCKLKHRYSVGEILIGTHDFPGRIWTEMDGNGRTTWIHVDPADDLPSGAFEYEVPLIAVRSEGRRSPPVPLRIRGRVASDIGPLPSSVRLPTGRVGETVRTTLQVHSRSGRPFRVTEAESRSDDATLTLLDAGSAGGPLYEVTKTVAAAGEAVDSVRFVYERDDGTGGSMTVLIHSYGLSEDETPP